MGAGGIIIIQSIANSPGTPSDLRAELLDISNRNPVRCSFGDAVRVCRIVWKLLRA